MFLPQINGIGENSSENGEKFSQSGLWEGFWGLGWAGGGKFDGSGIGGYLRMSNVEG